MGNQQSQSSNSNSSNSNDSSSTPTPDLNLIAQLQLGTAIVNDAHVVGLADRYAPAVSQSSQNSNAAKDNKAASRKTLVEVRSDESTPLHSFTAMQF